MQTRYPEAGAFHCAGDLFRALMSAAAAAPEVACYLPRLAMYAEIPAALLPEWRDADPGEAAEFYELPTATEWRAGAWHARLAHNGIEGARPKMAMHGPTRPKMAPPRIEFAYCVDGSRATMTLAGTRARLLDMAETVRKHWALYGGGPKPAEIVKPPRRAAKTWPANVIKVWIAQLGDRDHVGAMLTGANLGAAYYVGNKGSAFALVAPVQVDGLPDGLCSARRGDGKWVVADMVSGRAIGSRGYGSRAAAESEALAQWAESPEEKRERAIGAARADVAGAEAGRAAWCKEHGIEDPELAPEMLQDAPAAEEAAPIAEAPAEVPAEVPPPAAEDAAPTTEADAVIAPNNAGCRRRLPPTVAHQEIGP